MGAGNSTGVAVRLAYFPHTLTHTAVPSRVGEPPPNALPPSLREQEKQLFQLKFTSKQMANLAKKAEKEEKAAKDKVKKAMEKGDQESARIYAQNAIRIKQTSLNYLRLSSRLDAVASRVESAVKMQQVTKQMGQVTKGMDKILASMDVNEITKVMDKFESSFESADQRTMYMENAMNSATASSMPEDQVDSLLQQVSDEHGLAFKMSAADASTAPVAQRGRAEADDAADSLEQRLAALRG